MTTTEAQAKRLEKIRLLLAKAEHESTSPAEAEAFALKAAELMQEHSIDAAMLAAASKISDPGKYEGKPGKRRIIYFEGDHIGRKQDLFYAVALHYLCDVVVTPARGSRPSAYLFGYDSDMDLTEMLYTSLILQAGHALLSEDIPFGDTPRAFNSAWWTAYTQRLAWRLRTSREATERARNKTKPGTDIVLKDRRAEVAAAVKEEFPETHRVRRGNGGKSRAGRAAGYQAGSRAQLTNPTALAGGDSRAIER